MLSGVFRFLTLFLQLIKCGAAVADEPPRAVAVFTDHAPVIDGTVTKGEWGTALPIYFPAKEQDSNQPVSEVRFLWNKEGVYLAFQATEDTPAFGHFKLGEPIYQEDAFEIFIDQTGDHRQYFEVQADPAGQIFIKNYLLTDEPELTPQGRLTEQFTRSNYWRWDWPVPDDFKVASRLAPDGNWQLEMFLPASFINRRRGGGVLESCTWRVNLVRHDWDKPRDAADRHGQFLYWAPVLPGHPHLSPTRMGFLQLK